MKVEMRKIACLNFLLGLALVFTFTSCEKEEAELVDVQSFTDSSIEKLQNNAIGKRYCLEFVFPLSIQFVDDTNVEVESYEILNDAVMAWFEESGVERSKENKPQLVFPIQVLNEDGEIIDVATQEDLKALKSECSKEGKCSKGQRGKGFSCFELQYPVTITIDGVDSTFDDSSLLKEAVKAYKETAGADAERPSLVFPLTIVYEDGTEVEVLSQDELRTLKETCRDSE